MIQIISKTKKKDGTTEVQFGDKAQMLDKARRLSTDTGYMIKPKINHNLKIRAMTDPEIAMSQWKEKYQKNGKTTWGGAAKLMGDVGKTIIKRVIGKNGD